MQVVIFFVFVESKWMAVSMILIPVIIFLTARQSDMKWDFLYCYHVFSWLLRQRFCKDSSVYDFWKGIPVGQADSKLNSPENREPLETAIRNYFLMGDRQEFSWLPVKRADELI